MASFGTWLKGQLANVLGKPVAINADGSVSTGDGQTYLKPPGKLPSSDRRRNREPACVAVYSPRLREWVEIRGKLPKGCTLPGGGDVLLYTPGRIRV